MIISKETRERRQSDVNGLFEKVRGAVVSFFEGYGPAIEMAVSKQMMSGDLSRSIGKIGVSKVFLDQKEATCYDRVRMIATHQTNGIGRRLILDSLEDAERVYDELPLHLSNHIAELGAKRWVWSYQLEMDARNHADGHVGMFVDSVASLAICAILAKTHNTIVDGTITYINDRSKGTLPITLDLIDSAPSLKTLQTAQQLSAVGKTSDIVSWVARIYSLGALVELGLIEFTQEDLADNKRAEDAIALAALQEAENNKKTKEGKDVKKV